MLNNIVNYLNYVYEWECVLMCAYGLGKKRVILPVGEITVNGVR